MAWHTPTQSTLPTRPSGPAMKYIAIAVMICGTMIGSSMNESSSFLPRISPRSNA